MALNFRVKFTEFHLEDGRGGNCDGDEFYISTNRDDWTKDDRTSQTSICGDRPGTESKYLFTVNRLEEFPCVYYFIISWSFDPTQFPVTVLVLKRRWDLRNWEPMIRINKNSFIRASLAPLIIHQAQKDYFHVSRNFFSR